MAIFVDSSVCNLLHIIITISVSNSNASQILVQITTVEPMITGLQEALPKSIGLLPFDGGISG